MLQTPARGRVHLLLPVQEFLVRRLQGSEDTGVRLRESTRLTIDVLEFHDRLQGEGPQHRAHVAGQGEETDWRQTTGCRRDPCSGVGGFIRGCLQSISGGPVMEETVIFPGTSELQDSGVALETLFHFAETVLAEEGSEEDQVELQETGQQ